MQHPDLKTLRKPATTIPPDSLVLASSVPQDDSASKHLRRETSLANETLVKNPPSLAGRWLAIDLDDTLLVGSYTNQASWGSIGQASPSIDRAKLSTNWRATLKRLLRGKPRRVHSTKLHPFLDNPAVEVAFRPGFLKGLADLKAAGLGLVLVTASARQRVDFLRRRFPVLDELFAGNSGHLVVAEDLAQAALDAQRTPAIIDHPPSALAHQKRPRSLAAKTPWAISHLTGIPHYDLLIDDSTTTAELFAGSGLDDKLLYIHGGYPWSTYGAVILEAAIERLQSDHRTSSPMSRLPCPPDARSLPKTIAPPTKLEDPYYYPLLHYTDQF